LNYGYNLAGELTSLTNPFGVMVNYNYDAVGRPISVTGSNYAGVTSYVNSIAYRAFGMKQMSYANGRTLALSYDNRLRLTGWDIPGVMGWTYAYDTPSIHENTQRVAFANNLYDHTLDRSYDYDAVGRMWASHTGAEARGHAGYAAWGPKDGPYAENYTFDQLGNMTWRNGWGVTNAQDNYAPTFVNNKMTVNPVTGATVSYDAAGNLTNDGSQSYSYDATGQQTYASGLSGGGGAPAFTNDPLAAGVTEVKALHITELRTAINQVRAGVGLAAYSWTYSVTTNDWITANPILEMRTALDQALGAPTPAYSAGLAAAQPILAIHIQELRNRIKTAFSTSALNQYYDGDRLRGKKTEYGATTYYVRSSVLGGQVIAELGASGNWTRGYVYLGGQMLAIQNGAVNWVHQDPVTKSQRVTNSAGTVVSTIDLDPWGGETNRNGNSAFQPHKYTSYERDGNGGDDAMHRRYQSNWTRFSQPDPYDGSYDATNPQSFNRYSYVQNDPVNFTDPTGLFCIQREHWDEKTATLYVSWDCYLEGGGGGGGASIMPTGGGSIEPRGGGGRGGGLGGGSQNQQQQQPDPCANQLLTQFNLTDRSRNGDVLPYIQSSVAQDFQDALDEINRAVPAGIGFTEVFRTRAHQQELWDNRANNPNPVARPGTSRHEGGFAFDVPGIATRNGRGQLVQTALGTTVIPIFDRHGFAWGGAFNDPPHFQADPNLHGYRNSAAAATAANDYYERCIRGR
jgi:RHS repeat-associated protein